MVANARMRLLSRVTSFLVKRGWSNRYALLTTLGRKSGELRTTPVAPISRAGETWVVSLYGNVGWVHNARHSGRVTLRRGAISQNHQVTELGSEAAAPILKQYLQQVKFARPIFDATPDSPVEHFVLEAPRHPVFHLEHLR